MCISSKRIQATLIGFSYAALGLAPTMADDTDIFFGGISSTSFKPNVLFILDNSGSMRNRVGGGDNRSRMAVLKSSFRTLMQNASGINAGIMRFNSPGGSILFPVTDIDAPYTGDFELQPIIAQSSDDASEQKGGGPGSVSVTSNTLPIGFIPTTTTSISTRVSNNADDAEERTANDGSGDHRVFLNNNRLDMDVPRTIGVRFRNVALPATAIIDKADITFTADKRDTGEMEMQFHSERALNSAVFTATDRNITNRTTSTASINWLPTDWQNNTAYTTPNLSTLVQEVVSQPGWASGNSLSFIQSHISGSRDRNPKSHNNDPSRAPLLQVTYHNSTDPEVEVVSGLRFQNVGIPKGATVTNAYIEITPNATSLAGDALSIEIAVLDAANASPFTVAGGVITPGGTYSPSVVNWNAGDWVQDQPVKTSSITALVQQIVSRSDWCGGNAMLFKLQPSSGATAGRRSSYSFDDGGSRQPRLVVEYNKSSVPSTTCQQVVVSRQITQRSHDAEEFNNNAVDNNDGNNNGILIGNNQTNGFLFKDLPLAKNATIVSANLVFTAKESNTATGSPAITLKIQDGVNPASFAEVNRNITNRTTTADSVTWNAGSSPALTDWVSNRPYRSPDISNLIQPIVNNATWDPSNNALAFLQRATGSNHQAFSWDNSPGGSVRLEVKVNISDTVGGSGDIKVRDHLISLVDDLDPVTYTPIVDSLFEAAHYYRGDPVFWADKRRVSDNTRDTLDLRYKRVSHMNSIVAGSGLLSRQLGCTDDDLDNTACRTEQITGAPRYKSPIEGCQNSYIVLLTDGSANSNHSENSIKSYIGHSGSCSNADSDEACSEELAAWMAKNDHSASASGNNKIFTYTIAFAAGDNDYLTAVAKAGLGKFTRAGSESELSDAFSQILKDVLDTNATFVIPGTTVSQFNLLTNLKDVYYAVFKPTSTPRWSGNLKKFKISTTDINAGKTVGRGDVVAVDPATGFFKKDVTSFWSGTNAKDAPHVELGGAAKKLPAIVDNRNVYTYYPGGNKNLNANPLDESNPAITESILQISGRSNAAAYRTDLLNWARGEDVGDKNGDGLETDARLHMGDPLHSSPVTISYGDKDNPDFSVFITTNEGFLHAFNTADTSGVEQFAFMPEELLPNLQTLFDNAPADDHPYGLDSPLTAWVRDDLRNGVKPTETLDHAYLYFGMRRGGKQYYAVDVTNRSSPKLMWRIFGGTAPFDELSQTWSQPTKIRVSVNEGGTSPVTKEVLVFGGGYDPDQDTATVRTKDDEGRAVYMVEAGPTVSGTVSTPNIVWKAGKGTSYNLNLAEMEYSIPGAVKAGDLNGDGLVDIMFVADMGGQIWRFDINNGATADNLVTGGVVANLAKDALTADHRRFYADVDATTYVLGGQTAIGLTIGSGARANPLYKDTEDRFYMIKQSPTKPATYIALTEAELYDATPNVAQTGSTAEIRNAALVAMKQRPGWFIKLERPGEKVLSQSLTLQSELIFNSYEPDSAVISCKPRLGTAYQYKLDLLSAVGLFDVSGSPRDKPLGTGNIPAQPVVVITPKGTVKIATGAEMDDAENASLVKKTYWYQPN